MSVLPGRCTSASPWAADLASLRCPSCTGSLDESPPALTCTACGASYPIRDGILVDQGTDRRQQPGRPGILRQPALAEVPLLGEVHLVLQRRRAAGTQPGAEAPAATAGPELLDVAVGDGVYLDWMPDDWRIAGVDIAWSQLQACRTRAGNRPPSG